MIFFGDIPESENESGNNKKEKETLSEITAMMMQAVDKIVTASIFNFKILKEIYQEPDSEDNLSIRRDLEAGLGKGITIFRESSENFFMGMIAKIESEEIVITDKETVTTEMLVELREKIQALIDQGVVKLEGLMGSDDA